MAFGLISPVKLLSTIHLHTCQNHTLPTHSFSEGKYVITQDWRGAELYIDRGKGSEDENKAIFDHLLTHKAEIEQSFGGPLSWERLDGKRACRIGIGFGDGGYRTAEDMWPSIQDTIIQAMDRLEKALRPYINQLKLNA